MIIGKELIQIQDKAYLINRKIPEHLEIDVKWFKYKTNSDRVFKAQGFYYFVEEVIDVEPINDGQLKLEL
jgi:hypothetical protein